jgi:hypothetical protein
VNEGGNVEVTVAEEGATVVVGVTKGLDVFVRIVGTEVLDSVGTEEMVNVDFVVIEDGAIVGLTVGMDVFGTDVIDCVEIVEGIDEDVMVGDKVVDKVD